MVAVKEKVRAQGEGNYQKFQVKPIESYISI
jgi:hypothetical protein